MEGEVYKSIFGCGLGVGAERELKVLARRCSACAN